MSVRILVADDCAAIRRSVRALLEREQFEVVGEASDGGEAIALAADLNPDVIVLDRSMPRLDGLSAARALHAIAPGIHLIMLTLHASEHDIVNAFEAGVRGYVAKKDAPDDLARAVRTVCRGTRFVSAGACAVMLDGGLKAMSRRS